MGVSKMALDDITVTTIDGQEQSLGVYRGQVRLIVNVASHCGYTRQYEGLEALYRKYRERGFVVLGFPCNQFLHEEPDDEATIMQFCSRTFDVSFPMFAKVLVNGAGAHPLFKYLKSAKRGLLGTRFIKWNFTKFLVNREGLVVGRFGPPTTPQKLDRRVAELLD